MLRELVRRLKRSGSPDGGTRIRVLFYSPSNLNTMDGSAIWVLSVAETLHVDPRLEITIPLKAPERRFIVSQELRRLRRVQVVDRPAGSDPMTIPEAIDVLERLDAEEPFDIVMIRSFEACREAVARGAFEGRLWSCYVLEPERDIHAAEHEAELGRIVERSRFVVAQSTGMLELLRSIVPVPAERAILLPPAVPDDERPRADPEKPVGRLLYTGKFHPFYRIDELIDTFIALRERHSRLEFHVAGNKVFQPADDPDYAVRLRRRLRNTDGLVWHRALPRDEVRRLLAKGGVALSVWDYDHGSRINDLVVSTKLLDYAAVGLPVVLTRTSTQEDLLGSDYPLFATDPASVGELIERALTDRSIYQTAATRSWEMSRRFTYSQVYEQIRERIDETARAGAAA